MSLSFSKNGIIGGPLDKGVTDQLKLRKEIVSKTTGRTSDDIQYLNSNTGWVKVTSSVEIENEDSPNSYSSENAKNYQLIGGTAKASSGFSGDEFSSYSNSLEYGFVPTPGITSFQVQSKGTYGTLRTASFNFTVHSPDDFTILEQLYLRPGFTILLEWGHSLYLTYDEENNTTELENNVSTFDNNRFLGAMSSKDIESKIKELKKTNNNNYDALYGFIKNFSWSYNGVNYECQVDIVSKGEIIESIKSTFGPIFDSKDNSTDETYNTEAIGSELEKFLLGIKNAPVLKKYLEADSTNQALSLNTLDNLNKISPNTTQYLKTTLSNIGREFKTIAASIGGESFTRTDAWTKYITLRDLLIVMNKVSLVYDQSNTPLYSFYIGGNRKEETGKEQFPRFTTFSNHLSIDPQICLLPKAKGSRAELSYPINQQVQFGGEEISDILNIFVSIDLVLEIIKERKKNTDDKNNSLYSVIKDILSEIQRALGNINEFDILSDDDDSLYYIVDRKVVPSGDKIGSDSFIDLVGLSSEVENLTIVSKLSGNLTSMIAIAAQAGTSSSTNSELLNVQKWNVGLRDRHLVEKKPSTKDVKPKEEEEVINKDNFNSLKAYLTEIDKGNNYYIGYAPSNYLNIHRELMGEYIEEETKRQKSNPPGLIPFELSFTMKGIGGMKIGQAFKVNEFFLPERYRGNVGFIITGLDHKIEQGRWKTDVKTQIFIL